MWCISDKTDQEKLQENASKSQHEFFSDKNISISEKILEN